MEHPPAIRSYRNGITLIALIITIIVLLILAGVAISLTIDRGMLFGRANEAATNWNTSVRNEQETISNLIAQLNGENDIPKIADTITEEGRTVDLPLVLHLLYRYKH